VNWLLGLRRVRTTKATPVCYLRENGPIAYELPLFGADARARVETMLASELVWHWKAPARDWTGLTRWSVAALLTDIGHDGAAGRSGTLMLGIDSTDAPGDITDGVAAAWVRAFASARGGPLHVTIAAPPPERRQPRRSLGGDGQSAGAEDLVFVAQHPTDAVRTLLHEWGIDRDRAERRAYARLRDGALEGVMERLSNAK
jgi:hypothetical protein